MMKYPAWIVVGLAAIAATSGAPVEVSRQSAIVPLVLRPGLVKTLSKSQLPLLIDVYWIRVLNGIGLKDNPEKNRSLYAYGLTLTALDPRFREVYLYLGLTIPVPIGRNKWANADLASDLLRRGTLQFPDHLSLNLYYGFTLFAMERKFVEASKVFAVGSRIYGAPSFMGPLATRLLSQSGSPEDAVRLAEELAGAASDDSARAELQARVADLKVEAVLQQIDEACERFRKLRTREPADIEDLVSSGLYEGPLTDVKGGQLTLKEGRGASSSLERRLEIYE